MHKVDLRPRTRIFRSPADLELVKAAYTWILLTFKKAFKINPFVDLSSKIVFRNSEPIGSLFCRFEFKIVLPQFILTPGFATKFVIFLTSLFVT